MFRANMCPSSGETNLYDIVTCYYVWVTVCVPDSHPQRVTKTKCRIDTVISPDDGNIFTRNMYRK